MDGFSWHVVVDGSDIAGLVVSGGRITHGAMTPLAQPGPPDCFVQLVSRDAAPAVDGLWPEFGLGKSGQPSGYIDTYAATYAGPSSRLTIGAPLVVLLRTTSGYTDTYAATYAGAELTRFTGYVGAIDYNTELVQLTGVSPMEALARLDVIAAAWPAETDTARAARIAAAAGIELTIDGAAGCTVAATDEDAQPVKALALLQALALDAEATVLATGTGTVQYRARLAPAAAWTVPSGSVDATTLRLALDLGRVVNALAVEYGPTDARASVAITDTDSIEQYGRRENTRRTQLATADDAAALANRTLDATAHPSWRADAVRLLADVSTAQTIYVMGAIEVGDTITVPVPLAGAPLDELSARVIGITDDLSQQWAVTLHLDGVAA